MTNTDRQPQSAEPGDHVIPNIRMDQAVSALARAARAALIDFVGDDDTVRLFAMAVYLHQLCANPRSPDKMAGILRAVADHLHPRLREAVPDLIDACEAVVREHENLEDRAPLEADCEMCNLGTGPHKQYCAYHLAKRGLAKARRETIESDAARCEAEAEKASS